MKKQITTGLMITIVIFLISTSFSRLLLKDTSNVVHTVIMLLLEIVLSLLAIKYFKVDLNWRIPEFIKGLKVFLYGFLTAILVMMFLNIIIFILTGHSVPKEIHPVMKQFNVLQIFIFVFIGASIAEELLFRGFLLNILKPLQHYSLKLFKHKIGLQVIISALMFSMAHLGLLKMGVSTAFIIRILILTFVLGLVAGYFQEKYKNLSYAILVHMGVNLLSLLSMIVMHLLSH